MFCSELDNILIAVLETVKLFITTSCSLQKYKHFVNTRLRRITPRHNSIKDVGDKEANVSEKS